MSISQVYTPLRGSGKDQSVWKLEWTYSDTGGTPSLDTTQSDQHPAVATPLADAGTGRTAVTIPKCKRAWVLHCSLEPVTVATAANNVRPVPVSLSASAGTLEVRFVAANGGSAPIDPPEAGSRCRLVLLLERN
jgi:hypothetical protein